MSELLKKSFVPSTLNVEHGVCSTTSNEVKGKFVGFLLTVSSGTSLEYFSTNVTSMAVIGQVSILSSSGMHVIWSIE